MSIVFSFYCHRCHSCFIHIQLCLPCSVFHYLLSHSRGIPTVPGTVTLKKDSQNLIGISIGGGAQYCPCLYIVQVGTWGGRINERALAWEVKPRGAPCYLFLSKCEEFHFTVDKISLPLASGMHGRITLRLLRLFFSMEGMLEVRGERCWHF